jgi:hypothetical protein
LTDNITHNEASTQDQHLEVSKQIVENGKMQVKTVTEVKEAGEKQRSLEASS